MRFIAHALAWLLLLPPMLAQDGARTSPFEMVRFRDSQPEVLVAGRWFAPERIGGIALETLLAHAVQRHGDRWDKRFCEDLPQLLDELGQPAGDTLELVLRDLQSGQRETIPAAALRADYRDAIHAAAPRAGRRPELAIARSDRPRSSDARFAALTTRVWDGAVGRRLTAAEASADLAQLEWLIEHEFAYATRLGVDYRAALDTLHAALPTAIDTRDLHIQLRKLLALFGDGHSRARGVEAVLPRGCAPFRVADVSGRLAVLQPHGDRLLDSDYPWLRSLDGVPLARWLDAAGALATRGSRQLHRAESLRYLLYVAWLRAELRLPAKPDLEITLADATDERTVVVTLPLRADAVHARPAVPADATRRLGDDLGYVRLARMGPDSAGMLKEALAEFATTKGLIIDVRDNGGGTRDPLLTLLGALLPADAPPRVVNVAAYRLPPNAPPAGPRGWLADRHLFLADAPHWSETERAAIARHTTTFTPAWPLPIAPAGRAAQFSPWHYMVVSPTAGDAPRYRGRVVVLMNEGCFSATDLFLGAVFGLPTVTLMGTPSSGGSGRAQEIVLAHSGVHVTLSTMVSFRADGSLFDGEGVLPNVLHRPTLRDALRDGDSMLEAAQAWLRR